MVTHAVYLANFNTPSITEQCSYALVYIQAAKSICISTEVRSHENEIKHFRKPKIPTFQGVALDISTLKCFFSFDFEIYFCHARHETRIKKKKKNGRTLISKNPNAAELKVLGKTPQ